MSDSDSDLMSEEEDQVYELDDKSPYDGDASEGESDDDEDPHSDFV